MKKSTVFAIGSIIIVIVVFIVLFYINLNKCDRENPARIYYGSKNECKTIDYKCSYDEESFSDSCGCGCRKNIHKDNESKEYFYDCNSPEKKYLGKDVFCSVKNYSCREGPELNDNNGCGCFVCKRVYLD